MKQSLYLNKFILMDIKSNCIETVVPDMHSENVIIIDKMLRFAVHKNDFTFILGLVSSL